MPSVTEYGHGISAIDSGFGRPLLDAIHLIVEGDRAALVDTGTNASLPLVLATLADQGLAPEQVDYVILTHVHLDHAGGAGALMRALPNARLTVHPRGARHMADPARLVAGTVAVYGEAEARRMYGEILPVPVARILETPDGTRLRLGGRELVVLDTPGHARHHVCIRDGRSGHVFAGDIFGLSYRELDLDGRQFVFPSTTPVQFDPAAMHVSIDRLLALRPEAIYVTHYGRLRDVPRLGADLHRLVDAHVDAALRHRNAGAGRHAGIRSALAEILLAEARRQGWRMASKALLELMAVDLDLNAQGLGAWLDSGA
ncbi:MAG: Hydroxyacylglutathione hydrolase [Rhodocyclaceae bacterium]|nr:MAG: MBL fold metallo-hydrolase [Rhodocyclaceae bacterium]MBV6408723.1 Hydroxyacylglutathione hydrolase [Rhodocyclaceae bacterium]CAG0928002.1 2-aminobenzoylacetyl-CoA thioesterase [Rhodocyclaceae bacterium]